MSFFTGGLFWFIEGVLFCIAFAGLKAWTEDRGIPMAFWKWLLALLWVLFFGFTLAFVGTSIGENEAPAALRGGILFGALAVISFFVLWRFLGFGLKRRSSEERR